MFLPQFAVASAVRQAAPAAQTGTPVAPAGRPQGEFEADFRCPPTALPGAEVSPSGFDHSANVNCTQGYVTPHSPGVPMRLTRALPTAIDGRFLLQFRANFGGTGLGTSVGFRAVRTRTEGGEAAATGSPAELRVTLRDSGFGVDVNGHSTLYLPVGGLTTAIPGATDSGPGPNGRYGWSAPAPGMYDVSLFRDTDGTGILSVMHVGTVGNSASFRIPSLAMPVCAEASPADGPCVRQFEMEALTPGTDRIAEARFVLDQEIGSATQGSESGLLMPLVQGGQYQAGVYLRWYLSATGERCEAGAAGCTNVWAVVPPGYDPQTKNKWVIAAHGYGEDGQIFQMEYNTGGAVSDTLSRAGFVLVTLDNVDQNCYGNPQCVADVRNAAATVQKALSLEDQPYAMADSMGGEQILNAITHGAIRPRAFVGFSVNTSLAWQNDPARGKQTALVAEHYHVTDPADYPAATAGYDPLLAQGEALARLAAVPMLLFASPTDPVVDTAANTQALATMLKAAGGDISVVLTTGGHVDASEFQGSAVADFFKAH